MTVFLPISPRTAVLSVAWIPILALISFVMLKRNRSSPNSSSQEGYHSLPLSEPDQDKNEQDQKLTPLKGKEKLIAIWKNLHHLIAIFYGYFSIYLSIQALATTLVLQEDLLKPREVYVVYNTLLFFGSALGRTYGITCFICNCNLKCKVFTRHTWAISAASVLLTLLLLMEAWCRFFDSTPLFMLLLFFEGLARGALYFNV